MQEERRAMLLEATTLANKALSFKVDAMADPSRASKLRVREGADKIELPRGGPDSESGPD